MSEPYSNVYNKIDFNQILLVCAPSNLCTEYRKVIKDSSCAKDSLSVRHEAFSDDLINSLYLNKSDQFMNKYTTCSLLFFYDIEFATNKPNVQLEIYNVLKARMQNNLKTIIFSNCSAEKLKSVLCDNLYSLITSEIIHDDF